jgi:hypothetical protein
MAVVRTRPEAVLKPPQSKRWRDAAAAPARAKRLDCGGFSAALTGRMTGPACGHSQQRSCVRQ